MATGYFTINTNVFQDLIDKLEAVGKSEEMYNAVKKGVLYGAELANKNIKNTLIKPNMPSHGMYSFDLHKAKTIKPYVKKSGTIVYTKIGIESDKYKGIKGKARGKTADTETRTASTARKTPKKKYKIKSAKKYVDPAGTQVLIYGSPKQKPITGLKEAIYGETTLDKFREKVVEQITEELEHLLNG